MIVKNDFTVSRYDFNSRLFHEFQDNHYAKNLWPIVYILSDEDIKEAYVGETTDSFARMSSHLKNDVKSKLSAVHLITSEKFNKSATLDIESNLIKYISGDGQYKLLNGNIGLANHNYYQKEETYWDIFKSIWGKLRAEGITKHSIAYIDNSDLFKYSPYKSLSREQQSGLFLILRTLLSDSVDNIIIEGGAGTGKTILAVFLFKLLNSTNDDFNFKEFGDEENEFRELILALKLKYPKPKMALVVPMSSFRNTFKKVFKNVKGLSANMVIGPAELVNLNYDIVVVDESHRLRRRVNLGAYYGAFDKACQKLGLDKSRCSELDWVLKQAKTSILFYDEGQSIKPSDVKKQDFLKLKSQSATKVEYLKSQFRVKGGKGYVDYIGKLLNCDLTQTDRIFHSNEYEFLLFDSIAEMVNQIQQRNSESGLARLVAGFSWPWVSKKRKKTFDIKIDDVNLRWNVDVKDWINSDASENEAGCIHTTQGYDLNYTGVIFGNEISYDKTTNEIVILKENYYDKNGKQSIRDQDELKEYIINIYKTIMLRGIKGTYVYVCDKNLREYLASFIPLFKAEKSIAFLPISEVIPFENSIPLYDLRASAGDFSDVQDVDDFEWIELPPRFKPSKDLFACRVEGESMNKVIPNGSICLFRKYAGGSRNGRIVLVEHSSFQELEFGSRYTVKEYISKKTISRDTWQHESIILKPLSSDSQYEEIVLNENELDSLKVIGVFECRL